MCSFAIGYVRLLSRAVGVVIVGLLAVFVRNLALGVFLREEVVVIVLMQKPCEAQSRWCCVLCRDR